MSGRTRTKTDTLSDDQKDVYDYDDDHDDDDYRVELKDSNHEENKNCGNGVLAIGNPTICPSICPTIFANASTEICKSVVINVHLKLELVLQRAALVELAAVDDQSLAPSPSQCNLEEPGFFYVNLDLEFEHCSPVNNNVNYAWSSKGRMMELLEEISMLTSSSPSELRSPSKVATFDQG